MSEVLEVYGGRLPSLGPSSDRLVLQLYFCDVLCDVGVFQVQFCVFR